MARISGQQDVKFQFKNTAAQQIILSESFFFLILVLLHVPITRCHYVQTLFSTFILRDRWPEMNRLAKFRIIESIYARLGLDGAIIQTTVVQIRNFCRQNTVYRNFVVTGLLVFPLFTKWKIRRSEKVVAKYFCSGIPDTPHYQLEHLW